MINAANDPSGVTPGPGGTPDEKNPKNQPTGAEASPENQPKTVSFETYQKSVNQEKNLRERLAAFEKKEAEIEAAAKQREEEELRNKGKYEDLLKQKETELADLRKKNEVNERQRLSGLKRSAILGEINGTVGKQYLDLLPLDKVAIDPETGMPEPNSVREAVEYMQTNYPEIIAPKVNGVPQSPAARPGGKLSHAEWLRLPLTEQLKRMKEVQV